MLTFFGNPYRLWDNVGQYGTAGQATEDKNTAHALRVLND